MFYLIATILLNVVISAIFKMFPRYGVNTLQAIVVNYWVCVVTGCMFTGSVPFSPTVLHEAWLPWALLMGCGFISIFNLIAFCTRVDGITTTIIANKLSLVIPVVFSIFLYHESAGLWKVVGIALAFPAVYLTTRVKEDGHHTPNLLWPALLFVGSGLLDTLVTFVQNHYLPTPQVQAVYTIYCFAVAACLGTTLVTVQVIRGKVKVHSKDIVAGICVGIPNYFSIYYLIRALNSNVYQTSATIPILNIGILVASAVTAIAVFREKAGLFRIVGLILAVGAILLIAFGDK